ncbi:MAG: 16S rRNA (uracil(1498)-N(3))-methyltransferase [Sneathiella sp.]|nr:MAG: 16S rRNA (uracil(1498)-N(3))-methyltransferase [Sneathiella sp.]
MAQKQYSVRLFVSSDLGKDLGVVLDKAQSHYVATVMRQQKDDKVALFNGRDGEWIGVLQEVHKNHCLVHLVEQRRPQTPEPDIYMLFAPVKKAQTNMIVQKATELGAAKIMPVQTVRTHGERIRNDKLNLQALEAAEQCQRLNVPLVEEIQKLETTLLALEPDRILIFCNENLTGEHPLEVLNGLKGASKWAVLTGPEGGFTDEECAFIESRENTHTISLGPRLLRAETAAIASLTLLQATCGDW